MLGYNRMTGYNIARYNADGTEIAKADSFSVTDATVLKAITKRLADLAVTSDSIAKQQNKSVSESMKVDAWLRQKREDALKWQD